jgi:hypothetical protein
LSVKQWIGKTNAIGITAKCIAGSGKPETVAMKKPGLN